MALMEASWVAAWLAMLGLAAGSPKASPLEAGGLAGRPPVGTVTAILVVLASWLLTRGLAWYGTELSLLRRIVVGAGVVCWLLVVRFEQYPGLGLGDMHWLLDLLGRLPERVFTAPFAAIAVSAYLWWRGMSIALGDSGFDEAQHRFRIALTGSVLCLLAMPMVARGALFPLAQAAVGPRVFLGLVAGLLALPLARLETVRREARRTDPTVGAFHRQWVVSVFAAVLALWFFTLLAAQLLDFNILDLISGPLGVIVDILEAILRVVLYPLGLLIELFVYVVRLILYRRGRSEWEGPPPSLKPEDLPERGLPFEISPEVFRALEYLAVAVLSLVVLYALWRAVGRPRWRRGEEDPNEVRDSVFSWADLRSGLRQGIKDLRDSLARYRTGGLPAIEDPEPSSRTVREIYRRLLLLGIRLQVPRASNATPLEYQQELAGALLVPAEIGLITQAYVRARYGGQVPSPEELGAVRLAWSRVRDASTALLRERERERDQEL